MASNAVKGRLFMFGYLMSCVAASLCMISTATDHWFQTPSYHWGLWRNCTSECVTIGHKHEHVAAFVYGTRALMIASSLALSVAAISIPRTVCGSIPVRRRAGLVLGTIIIFAAVPMRIGVIWCVTEVDGHQFEFGYSLILGWYATWLAVIGGALIVGTSYFGFDWTDSQTPPEQREKRTSVSCRDSDSKQSDVDERTPLLTKNKDEHLDPRD
ncbi:lens fiber membrane intrinsic protein-like [Ptychodera flava]|uniref:lens fiber membrane intrinsic protein-like n=1 Tax=Ptychodera flava TaxID=63121 RepID=UPI00396A297F